MMADADANGSQSMDRKILPEEQSNTNSGSSSPDPQDTEVKRTEQQVEMDTDVSETAAQSMNNDGSLKNNSSENQVKNSSQTSQGTDIDGAAPSDQVTPSKLPLAAQGSNAESSEASDDAFQKTKEEQKRLEQTYEDLLKAKPYHKFEITNGSWKFWKKFGKDSLVKDCTVSLWKRVNYEIARVEWKTKLNTGKFEVKDENDKVVSTGILQMSSNTMSFIMENLQLGKKYLVEITNRDAESSNPDAAFYISPCPTLPTNIRIAESDSGAICTWDPCEGVERYKVEIDGGKKYSGKGNTATIPKCDYKIGCRYTIRVKAIGKQKEQKTISEWTDFVTGYGSVPFNVVMKDGGFRKLHVSWSKPEKTNPVHYYLALYDIESSTFYGESYKKMGNVTAYDTQFTYSDLPTGKSLYCTVQAVNEDKTMSAATESNKCVTSQPGIKRKTYSISMKGKPTIHEPTLKYLKKHVECKVHWSDADIGDESKNFRLIKNNLEIVEVPNKGQKMTSQSYDPNVNSTEGIILSWGKKYLLSLHAVYRDLDDCVGKVAKAEEEFQTKIGCPSNTNVQYQDKDIIVTWDHAPGADHYKVFIKDKESTLCHGSKELGSARYEFKSNDKCQVGNKYNVIVQAIGNGMTTKAIYPFTLGGVLVPTNLKASQNLDDPCHSILITWENPDTYKECTGYECSIIPSSEIHSSSTVDKPETVARDDRNCTFTQLKSDTEYIGNVVAIFADGQRSTICQSSICKTKKEISQPVINDPECLSKNEVKFHWTASPGATEYMVEINDKSNNEPCKSTKIMQNSFTTSVNHDKLFIGRPYIIKVTAQRNKEMKSLQAVKEVFLGGDKVPRHILPAKDVDDPCRTVNIRFDEPMTNARLKEYEVRAIPSSGRIRRTTTCQNTAVKIKYLRSNTEYRIEVTAVYEAGEKSLPSSSIWFKTDEKLSTTKAPSMMTMSDSSGRWNLQGATLTQLNITGSSAAISDTVRDIRCEVTAETDNTDKVFISWEPPSFNQHPEDYRIIGYKVELLVPHGNRLIHNPTKDERKAEFKNLKCGNKKYRASIKTIYEDIDADTVAITSKANTEDLYTRPTKPKISKNSPNDQDEKLEVEWNASEGANEYILEIFKDGVDETQIKNIIKAPKNKWSCSFSEKIGFGSRYKIRLTATVTEGKSNSDETDYQIIGGDQVPKNSKASKNIENPTTKADISWDKPNAEPLRYLVEAFNGQVCEQTSVEVKGTQHTMSQLKPGTKYSFKVYAVYKSMIALRGIKKSGGCLTNIITTKAAPSKIKKLDVFLYKKNPSTSAIITWKDDKADHQFCATKFQISLVCINKKHFYQEMLTEDIQFQLNGLEPGYTYEVSVTGGSDDGGFGEKSDPKRFTTELGIPHDIRLTVNKDKPSSSVILYFAKAEGMPGGYQATLCNGQVVVAEKPLIPEETTVKFDENIGGNTKYYAEVQALYDIENEPSSKCGEKVKSNSVLTAPPKSQPPHVELIRENDKYKSGWIKITWDPLERCNIHEVEIRKEGSEVEKTLVVEQKFCKYQCKEEGNKYRVRMRSQNPSGYYGEWSEYATVQLAPADLQHVEALAEDDEIVVKWAKPQLETEFIVQVYVDGNPYGEPVERRECRYAVAMNPGKPSSTYSFAVCTKIDELQGNMVKSNDVISKPSPGLLTSIAHAKTGKCNQIQVSWRKHSKCDFYQVEIKRIGFYQPENILMVKSEVEENGDEQSCTYLCHSPGGIYAFRVRCQYKSVLGDWSEKKFLQLVPPKVTLTESKMEKNVLSLKWKALEIPLEWYIIKVYCNGEYIYELKTKAKNNEKQIKNLCPGKKYYCEISAKNAAGEGKCTKTQEHKTCLSKAFLMSEMDRNNPSEVALLKWKIPEGVNCFKLIIQDKYMKKDEVLLPAEIEEGERFSQYLFTRGIPGSEYEIRLHCGYDGEYDDNCTISKLTMAPASPVNLTVSTNEFQPSTSILVKIEDEVNFKKIYKIFAQPRSSNGREVSVGTARCNTQLDGLTPGEIYDVYVVCMIGDLCSPPFFSQPIQTVHTSSAKAETVHCYSQTEDSAGEGIRSTMHRPNMPELTRTNTNKELLVKAFYNPQERVKPNMGVYYGFLEGVDTENIIVKMLMFEKEVEKEKLSREVRNLKTLHHENVVKYIFSNFCNHDEKFGSAFIIMEECDERTLYDRILGANPKPSFDYNETRRHVKGLCDGLQHIHASNIIHRDLKPQNILFRKREVNGDMIEMVVICDFGLSKRLRAGNTSTQLSSTSRGTNGWRAPETYERGKISKKADIFSLGLVIYHMLSNGQHAYGDNPDLWSGHIFYDKKKNLEDLCEFRGRVLARDLIESMLQTDPAKRPCIEQVQQHPFFWNSKQKLDFYGDLIKYMEFVGKKSIHRPKKVKHDQSCTKQATGQTKSFGERANDQKSQTAGHEGETKNHPERPLSQSGSPPNQTTIKQAEDQNKDIEIPFLDLDEGDTSEWLKALRYKNPDTKKEDITDWNKCFIFTPRELEAMQKSCEKRGIKEEVKRDAMQAKATMFQKLPAFAINMKELSSDSTKESSAELTEGCNPARNNSPVYTLLNFIRNRHTHLLEDSGKNDFHLTEEELWDFFSSRFPNFFQYVYKRFQDHYTNKCESDKDFTTLINKYFTYDKWNIRDESPDE